jgi:hypothetical protein
MPMSIWSDGRRGGRAHVSQWSAADGASTSPPVGSKGLTISMPQAIKSRTLRVATAKPCCRAIAAICPSGTRGGSRAPLRSGPLSPPPGRRAGPDALGVGHVLTMAQAECGFDSVEGGGASGSELLVQFGPTLLVDIGFDQNYRPQPSATRCRESGGLPRAGARTLSELYDLRLLCGVDLAAGGQIHRALIGRTFLRRFTMVYEGETGTVTLSSS